MKNDRSIDLGLTGYEELFKSTEERLDARKPKVEAIPLAALTPFRNHPFQVKEDEEMAQLIRSIADAGVLSPALARPLPDGGYELISGHRRVAEHLISAFICAFSDFRCSIQLCRNLR